MDLDQLMDSAGGREQPVSTVLIFLATALRAMEEKVIEHKIELGVYIGQDLNPAMQRDVRFCENV